jgi:NagD protein
VKPTRIYSAYILDLDGTVYLGDRLLPRAGETIRRLRELGARTIFLSNNPTHTRSDYAAILTRLGLPTQAEDVVHSTFVLVRLLNQVMPGARLFVIGEPPLLKELTASGFRLTTDPAKTDAVIASFDRTFDYAKLQIAFDAIRAGARFFATNADRFCPVPGGGQPDAAAVIAAVEACTAVKVEAVAGKPSRRMAQAALEAAGFPAADCLMVGDRLETDVRMGVEAGMSTALVLTGATRREELDGAEIRPDFVIEALQDLIPVLHDGTAADPGPR